MPYDSDIIVIGCGNVLFKDDGFGPIVINILQKYADDQNDYYDPAVTAYVEDEDLSWLKLLGFLETMGFSLNRIQTMSQIDMNSVMNDLIYKIAGVLLPMVYVMITANKLIAAQVSDGSMAYILSTPTNRKKVLRTQYLFLISSLFAMYLVITTGALVSEGIANIILRNSGAEVPPVGYRLMRTTLYIEMLLYEIVILRFSVLLVFGDGGGGLLATDGDNLLRFVIIKASITAHLYINEHVGIH